MRRQYAGATPPNRTPVTAGRFVPAIVTTVPPSVTPLDGVTAVSVGTAGVGTGAAWVMRTEGGEPENPAGGEMTIVPSRATDVALTLNGTETVLLPRVTPVSQR